MNISDVKRKIAQNEQEVADLFLKSVAELRAMRWWFQGASNNARVAIVAAKKRDLVDRHRAEALTMKLRHAREMTGKIQRMEDALALMKLHQETVAAFDADSIVAQHIADQINVDLAMIPNLVQGFSRMDEFEREAWREYRDQH